MIYQRLPFLIGIYIKYIYKLYLWEMANVNKSWVLNSFVKFYDYKSFKGV
jgi:hypothetical protein